MSTLDQQVTEIQMLYPRIYMACHVEHVRARSSKVKLSARDSAILAHLSVKEFRRPGTLARHLGIASSTLSEALHGLVSLGYVTVRAESDDQRRAEFKLSESGIEAMKASSVLDSRKVTEALSRLSPEKRKKVVDGLRLLADSFVWFYSGNVCLLLGTDRMPIIEIETVGEVKRPNLARKCAEEAGKLLGAKLGTTWVKVRWLPRDQYAENGDLPSDVQPCFVTVLMSRAHQSSEYARMAAELSEALSTILDRPKENIHILFEPPGAGRIAFGGELLLDR